MASDWGKYTDYEVTANRHEAYLIGIADAMRSLKNSGATIALQSLVVGFPEAYKYVPFGSRPYEVAQKSRDVGQIEYRVNEVHYHRPGNFGYADSVWMVPR